MTPDVITLSRQSTLQDALQLFRDYNLRHLVIVNNHHHVQGVFTKRDLLSVQIGGLERSVVTVANSEVHTAEEQSCIRDVAHTMLKYKIGCVPITRRVNNTDRLVGIVTESDFVRAFAFTTQCACGVMNV